MGKRLLLFWLLIPILSVSLHSQVYDARGYWKMEHDSAYVSLLNRQKAGVALTEQEQVFLGDFRTRLAAYFEKLSDAEKADYYKYRSSWNEKPSLVERKEEEQVFAGEKSTYSKYIVSSGVWGAFYGLTLDYIFELDNGAAAGVPFVAGGIGALVPILTNKDKKVTTNSLLLSLHGKSIGAFQGCMLGLLITGENINTTNGGKLTAGIATAGSITLGIIGYNMGKTKDWSQGRVSLYSHYGWLIPLEAMAVVNACDIRDERTLALSGLAGGAAGYFIADKIAAKTSFTRGDILSVQAFTLLNAGLGFGIMDQVNSNGGGPSTILFPAAGALAGTIAGQVWMKNANLTNQQGRNIALTTAAGVVIGLGFNLIVQVKKPPLTYIVPYTTGLISYALIAESYRRGNIGKSVKSEATGRLHFNFMPQNFLINKQLISSGKYQAGRNTVLLPAFSASITF